MQILVLGPGCSKCHKLADAVDRAAQELGLDYQLEKITDLKQIVALRVMLTPALVVDGTVKVTGRVPSVDELKQLLHPSPPQPSNP